MTTDLQDRSAAATLNFVGSAYEYPGSAASAFYPLAPSRPNRKIDYADRYVPPAAKRVLGERGLAGINALLALPPRWDGHRALPVAEAAATKAMSVLLLVGDDESLAPQFFPLADGGVQLEWHAAGHCIEIEIDGAAECHVLAVDDKGVILLDQDDSQGDASGLWAQTAAVLDELSHRVRHLS